MAIETSIKPKKVIKRVAVVLITALAAAGVYAASSASSDWDSNVEEVLGKPVTSAGGVLTYVIPRSDLDVTVDGMAVPTAAGVESRVSFYACSCGKTRVVGELCCTEDECNDAMDALRGGAVTEIAGVTPMFVRGKPHLSIINFQGEGEAGRLAEVVQSALKWVRLAHASTRPAG